MKKILFKSVIIASAVGLLFVVEFRRRENFLQQDRSEMQIHESQRKEVTAINRAERTKELDDRQKDLNVATSILKGIKISLEIQPQWKQDQEFIIQINIEKELGKTYLVDSPSESCLLYVNNRPMKLLSQDNWQPDLREYLSENLGSSHQVFRVTPDIPDHSELVVEWINYNPRTRATEKLRSEAYVWNKQHKQASARTGW